MIGSYRTTEAFRAALEERTRQIAQKLGVEVMQVRRQVAFDRLLARLFAAPDAPWILKGGYTFELRLGEKARITRDIDLSISDIRRLGVNGEAATDANNVTLRFLQNATQAELGDGFVYKVGNPMADLDGAPYGGARYPVEAHLADRVFTKFHLDVGIGDATPLAPEWLTGQDLLGFAGIPPVRVAAIAREQQFAEKIHAYTLPHGERTNTRVKDLIDLVLLIQLGFTDSAVLKRVIHATFERRATHAVPAVLETPPEDWRVTFTRMANNIKMPLSLDEAFAEVVTFWQTLAS